ncbi:uncharacterized protein LOC110237085 [Exaiptasia diaphana]|uniref:Uncharacterized protein n=1 Tax=Exaiptasia diaphana TaxID=2652724 RepID=A0A913YG45_EXADI|nr:uncharacterized protein LOC110237085 [Exaiptasia diaphana]
MATKERKSRKGSMNKMKVNERSSRWKAELRQCLEPFRLRHPTVEDFTSSSFFRIPYVLCAIRAIAAAYLISWWLFNMSANVQNGKMFIYFTNICFTFISFYFVFGFNLSCISIKLRRDELYRLNRQSSEVIRPLTPPERYDEGQENQPINNQEENDVTITETITSEDERSQNCSPTIEFRHDLFLNLTKAECIVEEGDEENANQPSSSGTNEFKSVSQTQWNGLSVCYQVYWLLFYISSNTSILLTLGYWYNILEDDSSFYNSLTKHVITMVLIVIEFLFSRIPVYLSHMIYPLVFTISYNVFALLYWAAGGTDPDGRNYIYDVLNYNRISFKQVIVPTLTVALLQPLIHVGFLVVAFVRNGIDDKLCQLCLRRKFFK